MRQLLLTLLTLLVVLGTQAQDVAADFSATAADSTAWQLSRQPADRLTLLVFYDPDCTECRQELFALRHASAVGRHVADGTLQVAAVCVGGDDGLWRQSLDELPAAWTAVKAAPDSIPADYDLTATPALYLLDADRRVMLSLATLWQLNYVLTHLW